MRTAMKRQLLQEIREDSVSFLGGEGIDVHIETTSTIEDVVNRILAEEDTCTYAQAKAAVIADRILADLGAYPAVHDIRAVIHTVLQRAVLTSKNHLTDVQWFIRPEEYAEEKDADERVREYIRASAPNHASVDDGNIIITWS